MTESVRQQFPAAAADRPHLARVDARPEPFILDCARTAVLVIDMQNDFGAKGGMFDLAGVDIAPIREIIPALQSVLSVARTADLPIIYLKMGFKPDLSDAGPATGPNRSKHGPMNVGKAVIAPDGRASRILIRDTWNTDILDELQPELTDEILYKSRFSGFHETRLHETLQKRGADTLIVTGCTTSVCVDSTVRDAMFRDYRCLVLEDCTAEPIASDETRTNHDASLLTIQILFAWISDSRKLERSLST